MFVWKTAPAINGLAVTTTQVNLSTTSPVPTRSEPPSTVTVSTRVTSKSHTTATRAPKSRTTTLTKLFQETTARGFAFNNKGNNFHFSTFPLQPILIVPVVQWISSLLLIVPVPLEPFTKNRRYSTVTSILTDI